MRTSDEIAESTEKLLQDLRAVVNDGEELLKASAHELGERGQAAREKLASALNVARETQQKLQARAIASAKTADRLVHEHPYQAVGIAFGVGVLLGIVLNRSR